jgi:YihY family inner membrane protein
MDISTRLDRFQRRHHWAAFPIAVSYKFFDDYGGYLAALITYYAFVSLFPLLLLLSTVLGFFLANDPHLQRQVLDSALGQFPVVGDQLSDPRHIGGGTVGLVIGIVGSVYGGLGAAQAMQYAMNTAWSVPRNERPNPFKGRGRSLLMVATGGVGLLGTTALSALAGEGGGSLGVLLRVAVLVLSVVLNAAAFVLMFRLSTARDLSTRQVAPGAIAAAVVWQLLQSFGVL